MKDGILLLLAGLVCAAAASIFWRWSGQAGFFIIGGVTGLYWLNRWWRWHKQKKAHLPVDQTKE